MTEPDKVLGPDAVRQSAPPRTNLRSELVVALRTFVAAARSDQSLRSNWERLALGLLVAVPMLVTAIALLPEVTIPVPSVNDGMLHYLFITNASDALAGGGNVFDHWLSQIDMGLPQFLYYQQLPHLVVIAIQRLTLGSMDLLTVFNVVRWVLLVTFPLTVYWSMRRMGFSPVAAAISAGVASLLSGAQRYGFEYDSYVWRGWGMYTQLWAMHLSFITLATVYRALTTGRGMAIAVIALSALVLSHLIYAYMMVITIFVILIIGINRANAGTRMARLGIIGGLAALISSYMWLPFVLSIQYDNATPYLQSYKYDSFGAAQILGWLVSGQLFDDGRLPIFTILLGVGIISALVARRRAGVLVVALFAIWLVLYFGRPSVAFLVDLLPLHDSLLLHRLVGSVDLAAIILMGIGGAALWSFVTDAGTGTRLLMAGIAGLVFLVPALSERVAWYDLNSAWMRRTEVAMAADTDAASIIATIRTLPPGRVYAGLPATWGSQLHDADVPFYDLLPFYGIEAVPPPSESMSLNSDYIWDFNDHNLAQYDLFNIRYVVAPTGLAMADFLKPVQRAGVYTLYEAPTSGYGEYVNIAGWEPVASQRALYIRNRPWVNGNGPADRNYVAYDYPSSSVVPAGQPARGCPDGGQILSQDVGAGRFSFVASCPVPSPFVIKATYHPNWQVTVDGAPVNTFMLSPSYIGIQLPAGQHAVTAVYRATPIKTPLLILGGLALLLTLLLGRRLNLASEWLARRVQGLLGRLPFPAWPSRPGVLRFDATRFLGPPERGQPMAGNPDVGSGGRVRRRWAGSMLPRLRSGLRWVPFDPADAGWCLLVAVVYAAVTVIAAQHYHLGNDRMMVLANQMVHGRLDSPGFANTVDSVAVDGRFYIAAGLLQAVAYLPFTLIAPLQPAAGYIVGALLGIAAAWLALPIARRFGTREDSVRWVASLVAFGTLLFYASVLGDFYYLAHVEAFLALGVFLLEWVGRRRALVLGVALGLAFLARGPTVLAAIPFGIALLWKQDRWLRTGMRFAIPILVGVLAYALFNYARFGSILEAGYGISRLTIPELEARRALGVFSIAHVPENIRLALLTFVDFVPQFPFISPSPFGLSMLLVSPGLLIAVRAGLAGQLQRLLWASAALIAAPVLLYYGGGYVQYGFRYSLDFTPFLVALVALAAARGIGRLDQFLIAVSVVSVSFGVMWHVYFYDRTPGLTPPVVAFSVTVIVLLVFRRQLNDFVRAAVTWMSQSRDPAPATGPSAGPAQAQGEPVALAALVPSSARVAGPTVPIAGSSILREAAARWDGWTRRPNRGQPVAAPAEERQATYVRQIPTVDLSRWLRGRRFVGAVTLTSIAAAVIAARINGPDGPWLWNFDMPFLEYPLASFFHEALSAGHLPLWNDRMGLGFPLYGEGQIGAFYPPNWLVYQLQPLVALDVARVLHLAFLGVGTGLLAFRLSGSRVGSLVAAGAVVLSGGIVSKLEWTNAIQAFAWLPWVLLPLARRPAPSRLGLVGAGVALGIQALPGHPNTWVLTGLCAAVLLLAIRPRFETLGRLAVFGAVGAGVGAVQLIPTALMLSLSVRSAGLDRNDLFRLTAMPFDLLGTAFANVFVPARFPAMDLNQTWYPGGGWSQTEIASYVSLPLIALAGAGLRARRAWPVAIVAAAMILLPIVGGQRLDIWAAIPIWNSLHAPVRAYMFLDVMLALLAAVGIGRMARGRASWRSAAAAVGALIAGYAFLAAIVLGAPALFRTLVERFWSWPPPDQAGIVVQQATAALSRLWPVGYEIGLAILTVLLLRSRLRGGIALASSAALVLLPLAILVPGFNQSLSKGAFSYADSNFVRALTAQKPTRLLALDPPFYWSGQPDQLAAAGLSDVDMLSSLNLASHVALLNSLRQPDPQQALARAVGIDTLVTTARPCPGLRLAFVADENATICRLQGALRPPYWIPSTAVDIPAAERGSPLSSAEATVDLAMALASSVPATVLGRSDNSAEFVILAPQLGWVYIDRSWWPGWQTSVDGESQTPLRALGGQLVFVTAGRHVIAQSLVPLDALAGLGVGLVTLVVAALWVLGLPRARRWRKATPAVAGSSR